MNRVDRQQRFCPVCASDTAEDEHTLCLTALDAQYIGPIHILIRDRFTAIFWGPARTLSSFFTLRDHRVIAKVSHECFAHKSMLLETV